MNINIKKIIASGLIGILSMGIVGCTSTTEEKISKEITVYTSVPQDLIDGFKKNFEQKYEGTTVNVYRATTGEVLTKLKTEKEAGQVSGDVVWVADFSSAEDLKSMELLEKYDSEEAKAIDEAFKDQEGYYYGSRLINMVLAYNTSIEAPSSWNDLLDESLKGKIGLPSVSSGSAFQFVGALAGNKDFGWEYFEKLRANGAAQFKANKDVLQKIVTGELKAGAVLDYMVTEMKEQGSPVDYVIPKEGVVAVASPIALLKDSDNKDLAKQFIEYTLSEDGQLLLSDMNTTPVRAGIETKEGVLSLDDIKVFEDDSEFIKNNVDEIKNKFNELFTN